jgi:hypothetical protein
MAQANPFVSVYILEVGTSFLQSHSGIRYVDLIEFANKVKSEHTGYTTHVLIRLMDEVRKFGAGLYIEILLNVFLDAERPNWRVRI